MQYRMKTHPLSLDKQEALLGRSQTAVLSTLNADGSPYTAPIHYVWLDGAVYFHGLPKGQKMDNILRDGRACFCVYEMQELLLDSEGKPCDTNTKYESIIAQGRCSLVTEAEEKRRVLGKIVDKYTPHLSGAVLPEPMVKGTAVVRFTVSELTGKYYD